MVRRNHATRPRGSRNRDTDCKQPNASLYCRQAVQRLRPTRALMCRQAVGDAVEGSVGTGRLHSKGLNVGAHLQGAGGCCTGENCAARRSQEATRQQASKPNPPACLVSQTATHRPPSSQQQRRHRQDPRPAAVVHERCPCQLAAALQASQPAQAQTGGGVVAGAKCQACRRGKGVNCQ